MLLKVYFLMHVVLEKCNTDQGTLNQDDKTIFKRNLCETESVKGIWQIPLLVALAIVQPFDRLE